jgi:hypothetical protein
MDLFDPTESDEVWYPIPGYPGYELSSELRIRSNHAAGTRKRAGRPGKPHIMKTFRMKTGYPAVTLVCEGRPRSVYLHHVVAELAYGPRPKGLCVLHWDDDKNNLHASNLYYGTMLQNHADCKRNGNDRKCHGSAHPRAKLDEAKVVEIHRLTGEGFNQCQIARRLGVHQSTVNRIVRGARWTHVGS